MERSQRVFYQGLTLPVGKHKTFTVDYLLKRMEQWASADEAMTCVGRFG